MRFIKPITLILFFLQIFSYGVVHAQSLPISSIHSGKTLKKDEKMWSAGFGWLEGWNRMGGDLDFHYRLGLNNKMDLGFQANIFLFGEEFFIFVPESVYTSLYVDLRIQVIESFNKKFHGSVGLALGVLNATGTFYRDGTLFGFNIPVNFSYKIDQKWSLYLNPKMTVYKLEASLFKGRYLGGTMGATYGRKIFVFAEATFLFPIDSEAHDFLDNGDDPYLLNFYRSQGLYLHPQGNENKLWGFRIGIGKYISSD